MDWKVIPDLWIDYYKNSLKFIGKFLTFACLAKRFTHNPFLDQLLYTVALEEHEITILENAHVPEYLSENIETAIPTEA